MTYFDSISDKFDFGKFRGNSLAEVLCWNPDYIIWVIEHVSGDMCVIADGAIEEIKLLFPNFIITKDFEECRQKQIMEYEMSNDDFDEVDKNFDDFSRESPTYDRYNGSYAQDEMEYSDDDIDIVFDGDPSAYWNID